MGAYVYTMRSDSQDAYATDGSHAKIGRTAYAGKPYGYEWQDAYGEDRYAKACNGEIRKAVGVAKRVFARRPPPKLYVVGDEDDTPFGPFAPFAQVHGEWEESRRWSYDTEHPAVGWTREAAERIAARWHRHYPSYGVLVTHYTILPEVNPDTRSRWQQKEHLLYEGHQIPRCNAHTSPPPPPPLTADERLGAAFDHLVATLEPTC